MIDFFNQMEGLQQGFWATAIISSFIFILQTILTFLGSDASDGINADFDGNFDEAQAPFQLFSFRNLINFMLGFGWTGIAFYSSVENHFLLLAIAVFVGLVFVALFFLIIKQILKLTEDNTFNIKSLIGKTGEVYIQIPANMSGLGKVQISANGSNHELSASSKSTEIIKSGTLVKVDEIQDEILIVSKF
ncbi:MAG: NfeD family protein [Cruoricaptor ignavus]|nr:NfeD family protein [Cruoricaptor ignavus]